MLQVEMLAVLRISANGRSRMLLVTRLVLEELPAPVTPSADTAVQTERVVMRTLELSVTAMVVTSATVKMLTVVTLQTLVRETVAAAAKVRVS